MIYTLEHRINNGDFYKKTTYKSGISIDILVYDYGCNAENKILPTYLDYMVGDVVEYNVMNPNERIRGKVLTQYKDEKIFGGVLEELWPKDRVQNEFIYGNGKPIESNIMNKCLGEEIRIKAKPGITKWVFQVPLGCTYTVEKGTANEKTLNIPYSKRETHLEHHTGDYIVCEDKRGKPDLSKSYVMSGVLFDYLFESVSDYGNFKHTPREGTQSALDLDKGEITYKALIEYYEGYKGVGRKEDFLLHLDKKGIDYYPYIEKLYGWGVVRRKESLVKEIIDRYLYEMYRDTIEESMFTMSSESRKVLLRKLKEDGTQKMYNLDRRGGRYRNVAEGMLKYAAPPEGKVYVKGMGSVEVKTD